MQGMMKKMPGPLAPPASSFIEEENVAIFCNVEMSSVLGDSLAYQTGKKDSWSFHNDPQVLVTKVKKELLQNVGNCFLQPRQKASNAILCV